MKRQQKNVFRTLVGSLLLLVVTSVFIAFLAPQNRANATASSYLNFQARLLTNSGSVVPDGTYNVEFKIYDASSSSGSSQGSCTGDSDCLWSETRTSGNKVTVRNGYLTVNLGSVTAFPTIDWSQQMWLTMNIGGTGGSPTWDGEMNPRLLLTAIPYAFQAQQAATLSKTSGGSTTTVGITNPTTNRTVNFADASGTVALTTTGSAVTGISSFVQGGVSWGTTAIFGTSDNHDLNIITNGSTQLTVSSAGNVSIAHDLTVDTDTLYVDSTNHRLGVGTTTTTDGILNVDGSAPDLELGSIVNVTGSLTSTSHDQGGIVLQVNVNPASDSTKIYEGNVSIISSSSSHVADASLAGLTAGVTYSGTDQLGYALGGGYQISNTNSGTIWTAVGMLLQNPINGGGGSIHFDIGANIDDQSAGSNNTNLLVGTQTPPSGNFSIYNASGYDNVFNGNLRVGSTSAPTVTLDVSGSGKFTNGTLTLQDSSSTAFTVSNNSGDSVFGVDTSANHVILGKSGTISTDILVYNSSNANKFTLAFDTPGSNRTITFPDASGHVCLDSGNCLGGGGGGANTALSNLTGVAINASLLTGTTGIDLGSAAHKFEDLYLNDAATIGGVLTVGGDILAGNAATATTATTSGTGTNSSTIIFTGAAFADNDIIYIDNTTGQDYFTRIVSGGGTTTATVSPAVTYQNGVTVTKYTAQNVGTSSSNYTDLSKRFFQGYFLGGIVTGAGSTVYADGNIHSSNDLKVDAGTIFLNGDVQFKNGANSSTAFQLQNTSNVSVFTGDTSALKVQVGSSTTDANAVMLILDSYNNGTDPSGTNGAIYYNTNTNKFRCYQNSTWADCISSGSGGANTSLSNLSSVAINSSLLAGATTIDLGSSTAPFRDLYVGGSTTNNFKITGTATTSRTLTLPDETGTFCTTAGSASCLSVYNGGGSGVTTVGTINGQTKSANGAVISGASIYLQTADGSNPGLVSTGTQTFAGDKTFSGTLTVSSAATFNGSLTIATGQSFTNGGSSVFTAMSISNKNYTGSGNTGLMGAASATVDVATSFNVNQSTAGQTLTLDTPTVSTAGRVVYISNVGSVPFTMYGVVISPSFTSTFYWNSSAWTSSGIDGSGANYVQNQNTSDQTGDFRISGSGRANTSLLTPLLDTPSSGTLALGTNFATAINLNQNTTVASGKTLTVTSGATSLTGATSGDALTISNSTSTGNILTLKDNSTTVFTVGDGGVVNLQSASATALTVQTPSAADTVFSIDASNNRVVIGNQTGTNANTTLFVLDSAASDPTGGTYLEGSMYFNTVSHKNRCYASSAWADCSAGGGGGISTVGALNGGTLNATGAYISGSNIYLQSASTSYAGLVDTTTQSFVGDKTFTSNTIFGDANTDTITFTGRVNSDIVPLTDNTYHLGSSSLRWADLYVGPSSLHVGTNGNQATISYDTTHSQLKLDTSLSVAANGYLNFGTITGASGYGIRDNNGVMEYKNSNGSWTSFDSLAGGSGTGGSGSVGANSSVPVIASYTTADVTASDTVTLTVPAGTQNGDLLVALLFDNGGCYGAVDTYDAPAGWTERTDVQTQNGCSDSNSWTATRVASSDTPGTTRDFVFNTGSGPSSGGIMLRITGANTVLPIDVFASRSSNDDSVYGLPAFTTTQANTLGLAFSTALGATTNSTTFANWSNFVGLESNFVSFRSRNLTSAGSYTAVDSGLTTSTTTIHESVVLAIAPASATGIYSGVATFQDNFNDNSIDGAKWTSTNSSGASTTETGQQMVLGLPTASGRSAQLQASSYYDMHDKIASVNLVGGNHTSYNSTAAYIVTDASSHGLGWYEHQGNIVAYYQVSGEVDVYTDTYNSTTYHYLRMRESGGTMYWEYSSDNSTWHTAAASLDPFSVSSIKPTLYATTNATVATTSTFTFDDVFLGTLDRTVIPPVDSNVILQSGNAFGATVTIGSTDANSVSIITGGSQAALFSGTNGSVLFHNYTNSTTGFTVQNATGTDLLNVDTSNNRVYVGDPTADSTGTLLVLDTKNTAGDPTGVNGAIYYNSNAGKFRCYQGSAWVDCINSPGSGSGVTTIGGIGGGTASADGASISGTTLYLQPADTIYPGLVNVGTQSFAGNKTFTGSVLLGDGSSDTVTVAGYVDTSLKIGTGTSNQVTLTYSSGSDSLSANKAFKIQPSSNVTTALNVQDTSNNTILNADTSNQQVTVGRNNSTVAASGLVVSQSGAGDSTLEVKNGTYSFYSGLDASSGNFSIGSSTAVNGRAFATIGNTTIGGGTDNGNANEVQATQITTGSVSGTVTSISLYVVSLVGTDHAKVAIYDGVGNLVAGSSSQTLTTGWNSFPMSQAITASTTYFLAVYWDANTTFATFSTGTTVWDNVGSYTSFPNPFNNNNGSNGNYSISEYMSVTTGAVDQLNQGLFSLSQIGQATFQNYTDSTTALQVKNAAGTSVLAVDTTNGTVTVGKHTDSGGTGANWSLISNTTGNPCGTTATNVDKVTASIVYNGSLYIGTSEADKAEVCQYNGGTSWTRINAAVGRFGAAPNNNTDTVTSMIVYNGFLYIATTGGAGSTGADSGKASLYRWDGGTTTTLINGTQGTFATTASIDNISSMAVYNGAIYIGTSKSAAAEVYRFNGSTFTAINTTAGTFDTTGLNTTSIVTVGAMAVYNNKLYIGTSKSNAAEVYSYSGGAPGATIFTRINTGAAGTFNGTTSIDGVSSMAVYNGQLYIGTNESTKAEVYSLDLQVAGSAVFTLVNGGAAGTIKSGGTSSIDTVSSMTVYNGNLYIGTTKSTNGGEAYVYSGSATKAWTNVSDSSGTLLTGGSSGIAGAITMVGYNGSLYVGTSKSNNAEAYSFTQYEGVSDALRFNASSDNAGSTEQAGFPNYGSITFQAENNGQGIIGGSTGSFIFSNSIVTATGAYDVAEDYPTRDDSLKPGDLVSLDTNELGFVKKATGLNDPNLIGVFSANPALHISQKETEINGGRAVAVALVGRVQVNASASKGAIHNGDALTSSDTEDGVAVKATGAGRIVGMAMQDYTDSTQDGSILVYVNPGFWTPTIADMLENGTTIGGSLTVNGAVLFKNTTNSTSAFNVQDSTGASMFNVDTVHNRINIGDPAGSDNPTLLVVGIKNTTGDPTEEVDGAIYYNAEIGAFRCGQQGAWRSCFSGLVASNTSVPTANTVANTTLEKVFDGSGTTYTLPANDCQPGKVYRVTAQGTYSTAAGANNLVIRLKFGDTILSGTPNADAGDSRINQSWRLDAQITCDTSGSNGTVEAQGLTNLFTSATAATQWAMANNAPVGGINTTTTQKLQLSAQWGTADAGNSITLRQLVVEALGP